MSVLLLHNPKSGSGKAESCADEAATCLQKHGIPVERLKIGDKTPLSAELLTHQQALVVVGGDGTVLRAATCAIQAQCPIYHFPTGNENLFARSFKMTADADNLVRAIHANRTAHASVGLVRSGAETTPFLLMCSIGPDAGVIRRLALTRERATGHFAYLKPVFAEACSPYLPRLTIEVDGQRLVDARQGWIIVANARAYALHLDPVPNACLTSPRLDFVFMPAHTALGALTQLLRSHHRPPSHVFGQGQHIRITAKPNSGGPTMCQIDGETGPQINKTLTISRAMSPLLVLQPQS